MSTTLNYSVTKDGASANVTSVVLQDDTATYGIRDSVTGTILVSSGTPMTNDSPGEYSFNFNSLGSYESSRSYDFVILVTYASANKKYISGTIPAQAEHGGFNDMEQSVMYLIGEDPTNPDVFTSASGITLIRDALNHAIWEICFLTGTYIREFQIETVANKIFYELDTGEDYVGWILEGRNESKRYKLERASLPELAKSDPWWLKTTSDTYGYYQIGNRMIGIWYPPSSGGNVLTFKVAAIPGAYTYGTDPTSLRELWENAAIHFAASEYYASRGNAKRATTHLIRYMTAMDIMQHHPEQVEKVRTMGENYWMFGAGNH
jgi:hypothetical protein